MLALRLIVTVYEIRIVVCSFDLFRLAGVHGYLDIRLRCSLLGSSAAVEVTMALKRTVESL
jgi:hypothetical protein